MNRLKLHWQILAAIVLALATGALADPQTMVAGIPLVSAFEFVGGLFLRALQMLVVPLIASSIISSVASSRSQDDLGQLGVRTIAYYLTTSVLAILNGLLVVNLIAPGIIDGAPAGQHLGLGVATGEALAKIEGHGWNDLLLTVQRLVPSNVLASASQNEMLGVISFSLMFGYFVPMIRAEYARLMIQFWEAVSETMMHVTLFVMRFAPLGVYCLVAKTVATTGVSAFRPLASFFVTVLIGLALHTFGTLFFMVRVLGRANPVLHFRGMMPAMLTAFSTASSSGTLPLTMKCVEENSGVSNRITNFVLPLGSCVNMDGTALYECVAAMFIAQAYGLQLSFGTQFTVVMMALLTSTGVAGIPAASLVAISIILTTIGLPAEAIGVILVTDRVLDMIRTAVNAFSDSCGALVIARTAGEETAVGI